MRVEELIWLVGAQDENAVLEVLLFELGHLLVDHLRRLILLCDEVVHFEANFPFDLGVDLNENLKIARHHVCQWVAIALHLLQHIVNL